MEGKGNAPVANISYIPQRCASVALQMVGCNMPNAQTQTQLTGNRIDTVWKELGRLKQAKYSRTHEKKKRAMKLIVDQIGKSMAKHIVRAVQKPVRQARKKARAPAASAVLPPQTPWPCARCNLEPIDTVWRPLDGTTLFDTEERICGVCWDAVGVKEV